MSSLEGSLQVAVNGFTQAVIEAVGRDGAKAATEDALRADVSRLVEAVRSLSDQVAHLSARLGQRSTLPSRGERRVAPGVVRGRRGRLDGSSAAARGSFFRTSRDGTVVDAVVAAVEAYRTGMAISEVTASVGLPLGTVRGAIKKAMAAGRVKMIGDRRFARYFPGKAG